MKLKFEAGLGRWLVMGAMLLSFPAAAQTTQGSSVPTTVSQDPADRLAANLVILSQNPRDVRALTEAGVSAVAVGDGDAALSFLARAEEICPRDGRIKAALGSALLLKEKPTDALRLFGEAMSLGVPEQQIARDRGLAYDLRGDSRRAQRDYALALRSGPDEDLTLRYALSLGISGDRDKALEMLDPLLRKQNLGAWRARAFILAMNGDERGAEAVAAQVMPGSSGASMAPFLRRLATLNPAERALAVNLGIMPSDGQRLASVEPGDPYRPSGLGGASDGLIPAGDPLGPRSDDVDDQPRQSLPTSKEPRRRPGREKVTLVATRDPAPPASDDNRPTLRADERPAPAQTKPVETAAVSPTQGGMSQRVGKKVADVDPERLPPEVRAALAKPSTKAPSAGTGTTSAPKPVQVTVVKGATSLPPPGGESPYSLPEVSKQPAPAAQSVTTPAPSVAEPAPFYEIPADTKPAPSSTPQPAQQTALLSPRPETAPPPAATISTAPPPPASIPQPAPARIAPVQTSASTGLSGLLAGIEVETESAAGPLPSAAQIKAARVAAQRKAAADAKAEADAKAAKEAEDAERLAAKKNPARIWVQVATGSNEAGLPGTWKKLKEKAPDAFKGLSASSVPFKATNRLLVGPFKSAAEARALVSTLGKAGISVNTFSSEPGQEVAKVSSK